MDIKEYIKILTKNTLFIIALTIIGAAIAFSSTRFLKSGYQNERFYFLIISQNENLENSQRLDPTNITDTAVSILNSPDFINEMAINTLSIDAKKLAPQVIKLTLTSKDPELSKNSQDPIVDKFNRKLTSFVPASSLKLESVGSPNQSYQNMLNNKVLAVFGAIIGFLASVVIIYVVRYLKL